MKRATVIKVENNIISLKFSNKTVRKFFLDNFAKDPYIGQEVEILDNGLIVEVKMESKDNSQGQKIPDKILQSISLGMLIIYLLLVVVIICKKIVFYDSETITLITLGYVFITLGTFCLSTFFVNNKIIKFIFKVLLVFIIAVNSIYFLLYILSVIWTFIACGSCLY